MYSIEDIRRGVDVAVRLYRGESTGLAPLCPGYAEEEIPQLIATIAEHMGMSTESLEEVFEFCKATGNHGTLPRPGDRFPDVTVWCIPVAGGLPKLFIGRLLELHMTG